MTDPVILMLSERIFHVLESTDSDMGAAEKIDAIIEEWPEYAPAFRLALHDLSLKLEREAR